MEGRNAHRASGAIQWVTVLDIDKDLPAAQVAQLNDYAFFFMDVNGIVQTWNRGVQQLFGYSAQEWIGKHVSLIFTPADRATALSRAEMSVASEKGSASDVRWHRKKDGTELFANGVISSVHDESGNLIGFTKVISDETDRRRLEDSLIQANAALEHFAYAASHDLQEPLRTIGSFAQLLSRTDAEMLTPAGRDHLQFIIRAVGRMSTLITDLLAYAKAGVEKEPATSISLDNEVEASVSQLRAAIDETGARVTHDPLPQVRVAHAQITRLFLNLISNAIKYRAPDRQPQVHISFTTAGSRLTTISVADNGLGFEQQFAEKIFEPFTRLHRDEDSGSGVGLTICRRIVERSGGRIWAESTPGKGSTFYFTLPLAE